MTAVSVDAMVFESLRALRKQIATESSVPPYIIFHDATLKRMAQLRPMEREQFLTIPGVGQSKLERYGDRFIAEIRRHA